MIATSRCRPNRMEERISKILARAGVSSRRGSERLILEGRISLNGRIVTAPGQKADPSRDEIRVDGKRVGKPQKKVYILLNKPGKSLSTVRDPLMRPTVMDIVADQGVRLYPVGRLDYHSQGVLLLTNDGELAHALLHPKSSIKRSYLVKVKGDISSEAIKAMRKGIVLNDGRPAKVNATLLRRTGRHCWLSMVLAEGRYREIRRICERLGHPVLKLRRIKFAFLDARGLLPGQYRHLSKKEVERLKTIAGLSRQE